MSIIAKVTRDKEISIINSLYPDYNLASNKECTPKEYIKIIIKNIGFTKFYRITFFPIKEAIKNEFD